MSIKELTARLGYQPDYLKRVFFAEELELLAALSDEELVPWSLHSAPLRRIRGEVPEMLAGAGTVLTPAQVEEVKNAGAEFVVSPGVNPRVLRAARDAGVPFAPGIVTPTDIEQALEFDCKMLKFFPAGPSGGLDYLKAIAAPYQHLGISFLPLGGINASNMSSHLEDSLVAAIGGSWLAPREAIREGRWDHITSLAKTAVETIKTLRSRG